MRAGFTYIETLVVVVMMGLLVAGGVIYFSKSANKRTVNETTSKIVSQLELARSNAKVKKLHSNQSLSDFRYVGVTLDPGGILLIVDNDYNVYSRVSVFNSEVSVSIIYPDELLFSAGEGKLVNYDGTPWPFSHNITVTSKKDPSIIKTITVDLSGIIRKD